MPKKSLFIWTCRDQTMGECKEKEGQKSRHEGQEWECVRTLPYIIQEQTVELMPLPKEISHSVCRKAQRTNRMS